MFEYEFRSDKFWEHVIGARRSRGLTQKQVGKELGVGGSTVSQWEKKQPQLAAHRFMALCDCFDLDPVTYYRKLQRPSWEQPWLVYQKENSPYLTMTEIVNFMAEASREGVDMTYGYTYAEWIAKYQAKLSLGGGVQ